MNRDVSPDNESLGYKSSDMFGADSSAIITAVDGDVFNIPVVVATDDGVMDVSKETVEHNDGADKVSHTIKEMFVFKH